MWDPITISKGKQMPEHMARDMVEDLTRSEKRFRTGRSENDHIYRFVSKWPTEDEINELMHEEGFTHEEAEMEIIAQ
jgi:hypothetical protein